MAHSTRDRRPQRSRAAVVQRGGATTSRPGHPRVQRALAGGVLEAFTHITLGSVEARLLLSVAHHLGIVGAAVD